MTTSSPKPRILPLYIRGMRLIARYIPHFFAAITWHSIVAAVTPYVTLWLLAQVLNRLDGAETTSTIWAWAFAAVAAEAVLIVIGGALKRYKEMLWEQLYRQTDRLLSDALLAMDPTAHADTHTASLLSEVKENRNALGMGLVRIPDIYQRFVLGASGVIAAVGFSWSLFSSTVAPTAGGFAVLNSPLWLPLMAAIWCGVTSLASCAATKAQRLRETKNAAVVAHDRVYAAFFNTIFDKTRAVDMRLWQQADTVLHHLRAVEETCFAEDGLKRRLGSGRVGVYEALSAALTMLWWGTACAFVMLKAAFDAFGIGSAVQYIGALLRLSEDAAGILWSVEQLRVNAPYLETVFAFLDVPQTMYVGSLTTEKRADNRFEITFDHVSFRYPGETSWVLQDISFTWRGGDRLAVVGEDECGKSTLVKLLCRLYDPTEGAIYLGGIDIRKYRYEEYIALIATVLSDTVLPDEPLGNVVAGEIRCDTARVNTCLELSGLDPAVLKGAVSTLSATERQQIALARALYKERPFQVLDEPTASMDAAETAAFLAHLDRATAMRGVLYLSHAPSGSRLCEEILVMERGRIIQHGTHEALLADRTGKYYALWQAQARLYI